MNNSRIQKLLEERVDLHGRKILNKIAFDADLSQSCIEKLFNGTYTHKLKRESLKDLSKALGVSESELVSCPEESAA